MNRSKLHPNRKGTNIIEANFKKVLSERAVSRSIRNFSSRNFAYNMNKPRLHFENSNFSEYDIDRDKHADKKDGGKDKCVYSIDIFPPTEMSGNAHKDLNISFEDSYNDYNDDSVNVTVTEHSSRDKVNANERLSKLKDIKLKNINCVIIIQLDINSLRNKFDFLEETMTGYVDIFLITESKLDNSFPTAQYQINRFSSPYQLDRNTHGGGILLYVREDIPSKLLNGLEFKGNLEAMFVEINLRKKKWLLSCFYNPQKSEIRKHL